jgi:quinol monooxygenase YgiN
MIHRIVRMTLRPDAVDAFLEVYDRTSPAIRARKGCRALHLLQDLRWPGILTTHSVWESEEALEAYRESDLFRSTWAATRPFFAAPAEAWSHVVLRDDPSTLPAIRSTG